MSPAHSKGLPFARRAPGEPRFPDPGPGLLLSDGSTARLEQVDCCLCGPGPRQTPLIPVTDWRYGLTARRLVIVRCDACGLAFLNPRPVADDMHRFYPLPYYERRMGDVPRRLSRASLEEQASLCGERPGAVLDVGCATGMFLASMRDRGWRVQGVEVSPDAAAWGADHMNLEIVNRPLPEAGLPAEAFDVVTCWSSLEHVHHPLAYAREIHRLLRPGGRLVVLIPNFSSPTVRWLHWGLDPPRHLYHFTPASLARLLRTAGFTGPIRFAHRSRIEDSALHSQVAKIGRRMARSGGAASRLPGAVIHRLAFLLAPVSWLLPSLGRGGAMIAIAARN